MPILIKKKNGRTKPPIIPVNDIPKICIANNGGKLKPEPIGFIPEYIAIEVRPTNPPHLMPRYKPDIKTTTVINSIFGISIREKPIPIAIEQKIAPLTKLFGTI